MLLLVKNPVREQIRMADRWQVRRVSDREAEVFVPSPWREKQVVFRSGAGNRPWFGARVGGAALERQRDPGEWRVGDELHYGEWNSIAVENGQAESASLVASAPFHIRALEARLLSERSLSVRVDLSMSPELPASQGGEAPCLKSLGLLSLYFTLSAEDGRQIGGMEVTVGRKTRSLTVEMPLLHPLAGRYRLKSTLCKDEQVLDNARIELMI